MNHKSNQCVYFDSNIYLAHYRKEVSSYGADRIDAIVDTWEENEKGGTSIVTSSLTLSEVIPILLDLGMHDELEDFKNRFKFGLHIAFDVDPIVAERAARYRVYYRQNPIVRPRKKKPFKNLLTPDAIHLATATIYEPDEFWTFDGLKEKADKYRSIKPLWLNNKVGTDKLIIVAPSLPPQQPTQTIFPAMQPTPPPTT